MFAIAERAKIPAEIWHLKTAYKANLGKMPEVLRRIEAARARGLDITANQYPYTRAANGLDACLPLWAREGGTDAMIARLKDPAQRERIKRRHGRSQRDRLGEPVVRLGRRRRRDARRAINPALRKYEGMTLTQIGREMGKDPRDAVMDLVIADRGDSRA